MSSGGLFNRYKFIDDYIVVEELNEYGKKVKNTYYSAEYYETCWNDRQTRSFKILVIAFSVACLAVSAVPLLVYHDAMFTMYVVLAFAVSTILSVLMLGSALHLPGKAVPLERSQKHFGFERLRVRALINCVLGLYGALMNAVCSFLILPKHGGSPLPKPAPGMDILVSVCGLVIAAVSYYCLRRLKTAGIHLSDKVSAGRKRRQEREKEAAEAEPSAR